MDSPAREDGGFVAIDDGSPMEIERRRRARRRLTVRPSARRRTTAWTAPVAGSHEPVLPDLRNLYRHTAVLAR